MENKFKGKKRLYNEEELLSLSRKTESLQYGLELMVKYPDSFDMEWIVGIIDRAFSYSATGVKSKLINSFKTMSIEDLDTIVFYNYSEYYWSPERVSHLISKLHYVAEVEGDMVFKEKILEWHKHISFRLASGPKSLTDYLSIFIRNKNTDFYNLELLELQGLWSHVQQYMVFDEEYYIAHYKEINILRINLKNNPWANPWAASETLRLFVRLNNLDRRDS